MNAKIAELERALAAIAARNDVLEAQLKELQEQIEVLNEDISVAYSVANNIRSRVTTLEAREVLNHGAIRAIEHFLGLDK